MKNTSMEEFSVLSPSQKKELEQKRKEEKARKAAAARKAREAAEKKRIEEKLKAEKERQTATQKKVQFWISGFALTALVIWFAFKLNVRAIEVVGDHAIMLLLLPLDLILVPLIIIFIWYVAYDAL